MQSILNSNTEFYGEKNHILRSFTSLNLSSEFIFAYLS